MKMSDDFRKVCGVSAIVVGSTFFVASVATGNFAMLAGSAFMVAQGFDGVKKSNKPEPKQ
jgi:hypothetical protein